MFGKNAASASNVWKEQQHVSAMQGNTCQICLEEKATRASYVWKERQHVLRAKYLEQA